MSINLDKWDVEDEEFWNSTGKKIATRNLWISIPSLLCGFAVWLYWGIITVQMINLGYPFSQSQLFTLSAIAGLTGATLRIPSSFITADDIVVSRTPHEGTVVATEGTITVALDTTLTDDLRTEGVARELVNRIQLLRRSDGLDVTDRVALRWASDSEPIVTAFQQFGDFIAGEVLALAIERDTTVAAGTTDIDGLEVGLKITVE